MEDEATIQLIQATIDKVRPFLQRDGGDIDYIGFRDGIVYVTMVGACQGCSLAQDDISSGVEIILMEELKTNHFRVTTSLQRFPSFQG